MRCAGIFFFLYFSVIFWAIEVFGCWFLSRWHLRKSGGDRLVVPTAYDDDSTYTNTSSISNNNNNKTKLIFCFLHTWQPVKPMQEIEICLGSLHFWSGFANFRKANIFFVMSVCLSIRPLGITRLPKHGFSWNLIIENSKIQILLKSDKNEGHFTWRPVYIYYHLSLNSFSNEECIIQKL